MKHALLFILLLISGYSFSQQEDSVPKKTFQAFFGCDCCQDTVVRDLAYKHKRIYECTLYKSEYLLKVRKKGRVVWKSDLREYFPDKEWKDLCIFDGGADKKGNERLIVSNHSKAVIILYLKNGKRIK